MRAFTTHAGRALPLRRSSVDTDQIIPAEYLKRVTRTGFADGLFARWRAQPGFVLDDPAYAGATILLAGPDFGIGSSREHAVWALQDWGFRAVVAARFGDIFRGNAGKNGLLTVALPAATVDALATAVEADPGVEVSVDLAACRVRGGGIDVAFEIDGGLRQRLLEGLDDIALTLRHEPDIAAYEARRPAYLPTTSTRM